MWYFVLWTITWAVIGSFGTAFIHEKTGRDVTMGGLIGLVVGAIGSIVLLACLWIYLYYMSPTLIGRVYGVRCKRWYQ